MCTDLVFRRAKLRRGQSEVVAGLSRAGDGTDRLALGVPRSEWDRGAWANVLAAGECTCGLECAFVARRPVCVGLVSFVGGFLFVASDFHVFILFR